MEVDKQENYKYKPEHRKFTYIIFISAISERLREFALARYRECSEYSSAADNEGQPRSPYPSNLA
jgi:hypothetical protein